MKNRFIDRSFSVLFKFIFFLVVINLSITSCDIYPYDDKEPEYLGASVYNYLEKDGHYKIYLQLVEDLNYTEVLSLTGSKTLFVANDSAFIEFFKENQWNVREYSQLSLAQKKILLNFSMINNSYQSDMLSNYYSGTLQEGGAFRRATALDVLDSLPFVKGDQLPTTNNWKNYKEKGIYLLRDNSVPGILIFSKNFLRNASISNSDFQLITGVSRNDTDLFVFNTKVKTKSITCKNGYLNLMERVVLPPDNMAQYIFKNSELSLFSSILDRFTVPVYDPLSTILYRQTHPEFTDSIFVKKFFSNNGGTTSYTNGTAVNANYYLSFDPGKNAYSKGAYEADFGAMFVPTDTELRRYFTNEGKFILERFNPDNGADLRSRMDSIPLDILAKLVNRHLRLSFLQSVPSNFSKMADNNNSPLDVTREDITKTYLASNGLIYETSKVLAPDDYVSVYGPVLMNANDKFPDYKTKVWNWAIEKNDFVLYLNYMQKGTYSFFVPTDEFFKNYIDPIAYAKDVSCVLKYWYNNTKKTVNATAYKYDKNTNTVGDSIAVINDAAFITSRLADLLNSHIVVDNVESGKQFYISRGNIPLKINGTGENLNVVSGGNMMLGEVVNANKAYYQQNGNTYFIDKPIQPALKSVYKVLSETSEFSSFYNLMSGFPATSNSVIFVNIKNFYGIDFAVKFFNTFNYTLYVPTNEAIQQAIIDKVISPWETIQIGITTYNGINQMTDEAERNEAILKLEKFIRYHFQDNSIFVDNYSSKSLYQSCTMKLDDEPSYFNSFKNKYYRLLVKQEEGKITLTTETNQHAEVVTTNPNLYNIMTRDYIFKDKPTAYKEVDGTGTGTAFTTSQIYTSSTAVIHQINSYLKYK